MHFPRLIAQATIAALFAVQVPLLKAQTPPPPPPGQHGPGGGPGPQHGPGMPMLHGLQLSEEQDDKIFAIMHAQAATMRQHEKALQAAHQALFAMAASGQFDEKQAGVLAQRAGQASAALALARARTEAQVAALLTPEQRQQLSSRAPQGPGSHPPMN